MSTWVFGYGSLVDRSSLGGTLGRDVVPGKGWHEATLRGWSRRWNYGVGHVRGWWHDGEAEREVTIVALGLGVDGGRANGVVVQVDDAELARLDHRERRYDRVDVSTQIDAPGTVDGPVMTYVPRPDAIERYETARDRGAAAIEQRYWDLVEGAFATLGAAQVDEYRSTTPAPDVPVRVLRRE